MRAMRGKRSVPGDFAWALGIVSELPREVFEFFRAQCELAILKGAFGRGGKPPGPGCCITPDQSVWIVLHDIVLEEGKHDEGVMVFLHELAHAYLEQKGLDSSDNAADGQAGEWFAQWQARLGPRA